ncbi:hypothetical protein LNKW23_43950 [Paralimibaculum aggregatum]|uniref:Uncharacterized protein n=1 Tax=Paralimibaculum aggregatum TaxID=3036245 RepID=A0ABQ6LSX4_9RHOB|nr:hypothetical protein [Limibaculum sp. NKW23]GMG85179.1 hypothetical protein LNKW23_43950 [Limibaculum sp. NKW23]
MSNKKTVVIGALLAGVIWTGTAQADDAAVNAALDACRNSDDYSSQSQRSMCEMHVLAMQSSIDAAQNHTERTLHLDFDDANDSAEVAAAKKTLGDAVDNCGGQGLKGGEMEACRLQAFHAYHEAMGN